ncbi:Multidrug resistance-associated protein 1, partial [Physocladia obscura]
DLPLLGKSETAESCSHWLDAYVAQAGPGVSSKTIKLSMFQALLPRIVFMVLLNGFSQLVSVSMTILSSLMIGEILNYLDPMYPKYKLFIDNGWALAFLMFGMQVLYAVGMIISRSTVNVVQTRTKATLVNAMYRKSLNLSAKSTRKYSAGKITTLVGSDTVAILGFIDSVNQIWTMPLQLVLVLYFVSTLLGISTLVGAGIFISLSILTALLSPLLGKQAKDYMKAMDVRTSMLREFLYGIKAIKYHVLEEYSQEKIQAARDKQIEILYKFVFIFVLLIATIIFQEGLTPALTFVTFGALGNQMTPSTIFPALSFLSTLISISGVIPSIISSFVQSIASYKRVCEFLLAEELDPEDSIKFISVSEISNSTNTVPLNDSVDDVIFNSGEEKAKMEDKLGQAENESKQIHLSVSQYAEAVPNNQLDQFAKKSLNRIETSNLSVLLENASFTWESFAKDTADVKELDPLSSKEKSSKLYEDVFTLENLFLPIKRGSLIAVVGATGSGKSSLLAALAGVMRKTAGKASIFGNVAYCSQEPWIISGTVEENITLYDDAALPLIQTALEACALIKDLNLFKNGLQTQIGEKGINLSGGQKARLALARAIAKNPDVFILDDPLSALDAHVTKSLFDGAIKNPLMKDKTIVIATHLLHLLPEVDQVVVMDAGKIVQKGSFSELMVNENGKLFHIMRDYHLDDKDEEKPDSSSKKNQEILKIESGTTKTNLEDRLTGSVTRNTYKSYVKSIGAIGVGMQLVRLIFLVAFYVLQQLTLSAWSIVSFAYTMYICIRGAKYFHDNALKGLAKAPIKSYRELKRLTAIMQSPLTAHISETLTGVSTINAFRVQSQFILREKRKLDQANLAGLLFNHTMLWMTLRMNLFGAVVTLIIALLGVTGVMTTAFVGIALSQISVFSPLANALSLQAADFEASMVAVERLNYYVNSLPKEAPRDLPKDNKLADWPSTGLIEFENLELAYASHPDHLIINGISLRIEGGEKIGVVGRTGSGKSTLMDALFRIVEAKKGAILIDGQNIASIGLKKLRLSIQMIPQSPTLFDGTIRSNMNQLSQKSDAELWESLKRVGMHEYVSQLTEKLDSKVSEGGVNLSAGQRQLLCLAKVLLDKSKILIMDEATSSVDAESDKLIQNLIATQFVNATVLSVAHRLNTIAAFDKVLVLENGKVAEFDSPYVLLGKENSIFKEMVNATGVANAAVITEIATKHCAEKRK